MKNSERAQKKSAPSNTYRGNRSKRRFKTKKPLITGRATIGKFLDPLVIINLKTDLPELREDLRQMDDPKFESELRSTLAYRIWEMSLTRIDDELGQLTDNFIDELASKIRVYSGKAFRLNEKKLNALITFYGPFIRKYADLIYTDMNLYFQENSQPSYALALKIHTSKKLPRAFSKALKTETCKTLDEIAQAQKLRYGVKEGHKKHKQFVTTNILGNVAFSNYLRAGHSKKVVTYEKFKIDRSNFRKARAPNR